MTDHQAKLITLSILDTQCRPAMRAYEMRQLRREPVTARDTVRQNYTLTEVHDQNGDVVAYVTKPNP